MSDSSSLSDDSSFSEVSAPSSSSSSSPSLSSSAGRECRRLAARPSASALESSVGSSAASRSRSGGHGHDSDRQLHNKSMTLHTATLRYLPSSSSSSSTGVEGRARLLSPADAASGGPFRFTWTQQPACFQQHDNDNDTQHNGEH